ncbi:zinc ABC transporter substrate-binding protein AztC [Nocardioides marmoraquaticus]
MSAVRRRVAAGLALALLGTTGCTASGDDRPTVVVTTNILGDVVQEVLGEQAQVVTLMKPNADPHSFEISAQEAGRMRSADLLVSNGLGLEEGLQRQVDAAVADGVDSFVAGDELDVLDYAEGDAAGSADPHWWTDPGRTTDVVEALAVQAAELPGVDETVLRRQADAYLGDLETLETEMSEAFAAIPDDRRALVTNHHVFGYLADRFDFEIVGAVIPGGTTLASPSASDLADLVGAIVETGVRAVFAESSSPDRLVQALAAETDLDVDVDVVELYSESLTEPGGGADDYLTMMRVNTERIADGLA